jgi:hypothetical protein
MPRRNADIILAGWAGAELLCQHSKLSDIGGCKEIKMSLCEFRAFSKIRTRETRFRAMRLLYRRQYTQTQQRKEIKRLCTVGCPSSSFTKLHTCIYELDPVLEPQAQLQNKPEPVTRLDL